MFAIG